MEITKTKSKVKRINLDGKLGIVNAAKVSYNKWKDEFDEEKDQKLIDYLIEHKHWTPLAHPQVCFKTNRRVYLSKDFLGGIVAIHHEGCVYYRISYYCFYRGVLDFGLKDIPQEDIMIYDEKWLLSQDLKLFSMYAKLPYLSFRITVPDFVYAQLAKHQKGFVLNQVSDRYTDFDNEFFDIGDIRKQSAKNKQCSIEDDFIEPVSITYKGVELDSDDILKISSKFYTKIREQGGCREQARAFLVKNKMTTFVWTGSLEDFARVCYLRLADGVQVETKEVVKMIYNLCKAEYPRTFDKIIQQVKEKY